MTSATATRRDRPPLRVGLLGWGTIARSVAAQIEASTRAGDTSLTVTGVASRFSDGCVPSGAVPGHELGARCDVVVEAAGAEALGTHGRSCLEAGADLLVVSIGALLDEPLRRSLVAAGPGRMHLCPGAIGGLDLLAAVRAYGPIERVVLETTKPGPTLVRPWMDDKLRRALTDTGPSARPVECYRGSVAGAVEGFPESLNVAAALALAVGDETLVEVAVVGSPTAVTNTHVVTVDSAAGHYRFSIANRPSPDNPRTSHITPWAVVRSLRSLADADALAFR